MVLLDLCVWLLLNQPEELPEEDANFVLMELFLPVCRIYSNRARTCPTSVVMDYIFHFLPDEDDLNSDDVGFNDSLATTMFSLAAGAHIPNLTEKCGDHIVETLTGLLARNCRLVVPTLLKRASPI
eukprot:TRINITY_DN1607_c1_g1_i1.p1 TRINITY_DN1607_c1_g1~~TRINITY_DN1607_c1_g1_i1.p1  ORF type:complete len:126 (+),score=22.52 TRINITY_DN1607_c1_g1_i1:322-699(+)